MTEKIDFVFVFGSNEAGKHGLGAALRAKQVYGAVWGQGEGLQGKSYGIPTKDSRLRTLSLSKIERYITTFKIFAQKYPQKKFFVTEVGTGLAGLKHEDIAPMFIGSPTNCVFSTTWKKYLEDPDRLMVTSPVYSYFEGNL